jgi:DNA-binding CsgD family transcriptional regulator
VDRIREAVDELTASAILGEGWEQALSTFAYASGAHGAVLMRNRASHLMAAISTEEVAEAVKAFAAGQAPPNSRYHRLNYDRAPAFRIDHDDYTDAELARDPYYQDFLRSVGFFWHANVPLMVGHDDLVELSLKRRLQFGPYERADALVLDTIVPDLLTASRLAKQTLDAEARGMTRLLAQRGSPVFQLDFRGRVLSRHPALEADPGCPVQVIGRRLVAADPAMQPMLDQAIARVRAPSGGKALVPLIGPQDRRYFLQLLSVPGRARDVFLSATALAVLIDGDAPPPRVRLDAAIVALAFALTDREADVARLIAQGMAIADVARSLGVQISTVRVHLRSIFEKTGTNRQAELVALLARVRP